ncbi:hypothetical protein [Martelella sp. FOR1707]
MTRLVLIIMAGLAVAAFSAMPPIVGLCVGSFAAWTLFLIGEGCALHGEDLADDLKDEWEDY